MPLRCSLSSGLEPGRSVPSLRRISYCCGVSWARHSASVFSISNFCAAFSPASAGDALSQRKAARPNRPATVVNRMRRSNISFSMRERLRPEIRALTVDVTLPGGVFLTSSRGAVLLRDWFHGFRHRLRQWGRPGPNPGRRTARTGPGGPVGFGQPRLAFPVLDPGTLAIAGKRACGGGTRPAPDSDQLPGNPPGRSPRPDQLERREQLPALVAPQDAAGDHLPGHGRGVHALAAEAACDPEAFAQLADLRHAMHGLAGGAAEHVGDLDIAEMGKDRPDPPPDGAGKALRPCGPGGL